VSQQVLRNLAATA